MAKFQYVNLLVIVFREDDVVDARTPHQIVPPAVVLPPGEYVVVSCEIGMVGGNLIGLARASARRINVARTLKSEDLCFLHLGKKPRGVRVTQIRTDALSDQQRRRTIDEIESVDRWWWENGTREAKTALGASYSKRDEARELVSKGVDLLKIGRLPEARNVIIEGLEMYPETGGARVHLGRIAIEQGQIDEAIRWFQEELGYAAEPRELQAHSYLAAIYRFKGDDGGYRRHDQAAARTEEYRHQPSALAPEAVEAIRRAVLAGGTSERSTSVRIQEPQAGTSKRKWWQIWK